MRLIKLDAISSTNDFLKEMILSNSVENYTCVVAENQTDGRGQRGAGWTVESGKNLTFSIYIQDAISDISEIYLLNVAISVSIIEILKRNNISNLSIKWPNDIMAEGKKLGGILIENSIKGDGSITSIVGIGLNVNQLLFENLPTATSMSRISSSTFDKELLLLEFLDKIEATLSTIKFRSEDLWSFYKLNLFRKDLPTAFELETGKRIMGIIRDVSAQGLLLVEHEDDQIASYNIKEIKMLY